MCLDVGEVPLLKNIRTSLIDPDTPESVKKITSTGGKEWKLVVSHGCPLDRTTIPFYTHIYCSFRTSSTQTDGRFMMVTIRTSKRWISGTV